MPLAGSLILQCARVTLLLADSVEVADSGVGKPVEEELPAELTQGLAAWQQFQDQAKPLLLGRAQEDLLQAQTAGKEAEKLLMEVCCSRQLLLFTHSACAPKLSSRCSLDSAGWCSRSETT